jgi:hypothetical protein
MALSLLDVKDRFRICIKIKQAVLNKYVQLLITTNILNNQERRILIQVLYNVMQKNQ